jgi:PhoPQ-activated pathogenicity-related protein
MRKKPSIFALLALTAAISAAMLAPASAEFFGCDNAHGKTAAVHRYTDDFAAQTVRPHITVHPRRSHHLRRNAKRYCRAWLAKEYRVSGPVVVPQMRCVWR